MSPNTDPASVSRETVMASSEPSSSSSIVWVICGTLLSEMTIGRSLFVIAEGPESLEVLGVCESLSEMSDPELIVITLSPLNEIKRW